MKSSKRKFLIIIITILVFSTYFSRIVTNIISPKIQIFIDFEKYNEGYIEVGDYQNNIIKLNNDNVYNYETKIYNKTINLSFKYDGKSLNNVKINDANFDKYIKISDYTSVNHYKDIYCLKTNISSNNYYLIFIICFIFFFTIFYLISKEFSKHKSFFSKFIYSSSSIKKLGKKPIIITSVVTIFTLVLYVGCDLNVISESIILFEKGVDFYQLFAIFNKVKGVSLLMWQYDVSMLSIYNLPSLLFSPLLNFFNPLKYHWIQVIEYKIINLILYQGLILGILSFLIDKNYISEKKLKLTYYLSFFNPLTFYVTFVFLQFDILPAYLLGIGVLLCDNLKENKYFSAVLISLALSCKMTMWMFIPSLLVLFLFIFLKSKNKSDSIIHMIIIFITLFVLLIIPRIIKSPIALALSKLDQSQRIWLTTIQYLPNLFLFISVFLLIFCFISIFYDISIKDNIEKILLIQFLSFGCITLAFSFSTVSTPSFYIQCLPAIIIVLALCNNDFSKLFIFGFLVLIPLIYMCNAEGDITNSLLFFNKTPIFTMIVNHFNEIGEGIKYESLLFTISQSGMFCYLYIFYRYIKNIKFSKQLPETK